MNAEAGNYRNGSYGAGTGATVGKLLGMDHCMKSGIGSYAVQVGPLQVGAVVAVNALGDIYDYETGRKAAGLLADDGRTFLDSELLALQSIEVKENKFVGNTTIGVVFTNARFDKSRLCKIAGMAQDGYARAIRPVHTTADGTASTLFHWAMWPLIRMLWGRWGRARWPRPFCGPCRRQSLPMVSRRSAACKAALHDPRTAGRPPAKQHRCKITLRGDCTAPDFGV